MNFYSDIDLTLTGDIAPTLLCEIFRQIDDLLLPYELDLSAFSSLSYQPFIDEINHTGKVIYRRK